MTEAQGLYDEKVDDVFAAEASLLEELKGIPKEKAARIRHFAQALASAQVQLRLLDAVITTSKFGTDLAKRDSPTPKKR